MEASQTERGSLWKRVKLRGAACGSALARDPDYGVLISTDRAQARPRKSLSHSRAASALTRS